MSISAQARYRFECLRCGTLYTEPAGFCWSCAGEGYIHPRSYRPASQALPKAREQTAHEIATARHRVFSPSRYPYLKLGHGSMAAMHGPPGGQKSTMGTILADCMSPSLYMPLEEKDGPALAERLRRLEVYSKQIVFACPESLSGLVDLIQRHKPRAVVLDSVQVCSLLPEEFLKICRDSGGVGIAILQQTKAKIPAGSSQWLYLADAVISVEAGIWTVQKSRFQQIGVTGSVL